MKKLTSFYFVLIDVLALASSLQELSVKTREARNALWSGLQLCSVDMPKRCMILASRMAALNVWSNKVENTYFSVLDNSDSENDEDEECSSFNVSDKE